TAAYRVRVLEIALAAAALAQPGRIVFTSWRTPPWGRSRLEQVSADGRVRVLAVAPDEGAAFSPDGKLVAWVAPGEPRRLLVRPATGAPSRALRPGPRPVRPPARPPAPPP